MVADGFSTEKAIANRAEIKALQKGDVSYKEKSSALAARARVEVDGILAEKTMTSSQVISQSSKLISIK